MIDKVAVLGAGVMGGGIAAHLANAGFQVLLLDRVPPGASGGARNELAATARDAMARGKGGGLYVPSLADAVEVGNLEDDLPRLRTCGWVIEAVLEDAEVKGRLFAEIVPHLGETAVLSTNTSGLSVERLAEGLPPDVRRRFLATHFFNPPRHMRLVEVVPSSSTAPALVDAVCDLVRRRLGKGAVRAKDTTNFIANRIGVYSMMNGFRHAERLGLSVEEVDAVSGPLTARPASALFRLADLVGLDTLAKVGSNSHLLLVDDEEREVFRPPALLSALVARGQLGDKTRQGFYRTERSGGKDTRLVWSIQRAEYAPEAPARLEALAAARSIEDPGARLRAVLGDADRLAELAWCNLRDTFLYAFKRAPEIADDVAAVDDAMRWGFSWELGPFEMMDALGVRAVVERAERDGVAVPRALREVRSFYVEEGGRRASLRGGSTSYRPIPEPPGRVDLARVRASSGPVEGNASASVLDLGDGVLCVEFHTKANALSQQALAVLERGLRRAERHGVALVVANQGKSFSAGADLSAIARDIEARAFDRIEQLVADFQRTFMALKCATVPVVAAPHGFALGGGCELCLHATAVVAHAETRLGLVEAGAGLLPAGGGTKELAVRAIRLAEEHRIDATPLLAKGFDAIAGARMSGSADEARQLGLLRAGDAVSLDPDERLRDAKLYALALAANHRPSPPARGLPAPGRNAVAVLGARLYNQRVAGFISEHDERIGLAVARVLAGGDVATGTPVSEDDLLGLEREAFLSLCGEPRTLARIRHLLDTGRPLRN